MIQPDYHISSLEPIHFNKENVENIISNSKNFNFLCKIVYHIYLAIKQCRLSIKWHLMFKCFKTFCYKMGAFAS